MKTVKAMTVLLMSLLCACAQAQAADESGTTWNADGISHTSSIGRIYFNYGASPEQVRTAVCMDNRGVIRYKAPGSAGRNCDGPIPTLSIHQALEVCPEGTYLPTIRNLIQHTVNHYHAPAIREATSNQYFLEGYELVNATNPSGREDRFFATGYLSHYDGDLERVGYQAPDRELAERDFLTSSRNVDMQTNSRHPNLEWYYHVRFSNGSSYVSPGGSGAVMCFRPRG